MSRPPVFPQQSASGIAMDPRTLERVIPESKRADGSVRKQIKIRPGFTPQEDVSRFRGTRQQAMDAAALPKGHILGWVAPSSESQQKAKGGGTASVNKNAKKRANQKARKAAEKAEAVKDDWEDDDDAEGAQASTARTPDGKMNVATKEGDKSTAEDEAEAEVTDKLSKLKVK